MSVEESKVFVEVATDLAAKSAAVKVSKAAAVEATKPIVLSGFGKAHCKPWGDAEWDAAGGTIPKARKATIQNARNIMFAAAINSSPDWLKQVGDKLGVSITEIQPNTVNDYLAKCPKSVAEGELKTIQNLLSELFSDLGYAMARKARKAFTAETVCKYLENAGADLDVACDGIVMYSEVLSQDIDFSRMGGTAAISAKDMILAVAAMSPQEIGAVLGVEGAMELAMRLADALQPVA